MKLTTLICVSLSLVGLSACSSSSGSTSSRGALRPPPPQSRPAAQHVDPIAHAEANRRNQYRQAHEMPPEPQPPVVPELKQNTADPIAHAQVHQQRSYAEANADRHAAEQALFQAQTYTGLSDAQLAQIRTAEVALLRGDHRAAHDRLERLNTELAQSFSTYRVRSGDTLWRIAGRNSVYGNPELWPLIWHVNRDELPSPSKVLVDQVLKIRPNPTVAEVVQAINESRNWRPGRVEIGTIERVQ